MRNKSRMRKLLPPDVVYHRGDEIARLISGLFCASSKRRTMTSHLVVLQMCFDRPLIASENNIRPAARSTASTDGDWCQTPVRWTTVIRHTGDNEALQGRLI